MRADPMSEAYSVPVALAVHLWTALDGDRLALPISRQCFLEQTAQRGRWYDRADAERRPLTRSVGHKNDDREPSAVVDRLYV